MEYSEGYYMGINWISCPTHTASGQVLKVKILAEKYTEIYITPQLIKAAGGDYFNVINGFIETQILKAETCQQ